MVAKAVVESAVAARAAAVRAAAETEAAVTVAVATAATTTATTATTTTRVAAVKEAPREASVRRSRGRAARLCSKSHAGQRRRVSSACRGHDARQKGGLRRRRIEDGRSLASSCSGTINGRIRGAHAHEEPEVQKIRGSEAQIFGGSILAIYTRALLCPTRPGFEGDSGTTRLRVVADGPRMVPAA